MPPGAPRGRSAIWGDAERQALEDVLRKGHELMQRLIARRGRERKHEPHYDAAGRRCLYHTTTEPIGKRRDLS